ncbi:MAG TPA: flavin reductase family protein [Yinghuangia sp.]|jgi:4-nitrophenol 2-monooxygenase / 4-nitrocatechol 4-monooxygenase, reductase component|uniref:flavin reductase family protein n=1 Tax=Yinghuangia sp. YIM S10712 TaxID=3436930 RepID=UPI002C35E086|nr:flavin reductase family protein [Yinghuangia sp.]
MTTVTGEEFRDLIGRFASGVTVITTVCDGVPYGTTASAMTSVSLDPPMLLVCMNKSSATGQAIAASRHFAVNVLAEEQADLSARFARRGSSFDDIDVNWGENGAPLLPDALATFECRIADEVVAGTHVVVIGTVERASGRAGLPLAYFRGKFGRLAVDTADV